MVLKRIGLCLAGVGIGALNGLLGGGGGMITVPALHYLLGLDVKRSHATAIAVMLPLSVVSAAVYTVGGVYHVGLGLWSALGVTLGGLGGAVLLGRMRSNVVAGIFYAVMAVAGVYSAARWFGLF